MKLQAHSDDNFMHRPSHAVYAAAPRLPPPILSPMPPAHPVMLNSVVSTTNVAYYTGIDTSDAVSLSNSTTNQQQPYIQPEDNADDPPPPYLPATTAPPIYRDRSLRQNQPPPQQSQTHLMAEHPIERTLSPFADPRDDDAVSIISDPGEMVGRYGNRRDDDDMSVVSDLSYQGEERTVHHAV